MLLVQERRRVLVFSVRCRLKLGNSAWASVVAVVYTWASEALVGYIPASSVVVGYRLASWEEVPCTSAF